ncbi:MAG: PQQ-binding-like beta-propeller repeat protein [Bacteroidales bacterium]|nr:PQQ-binding-like beta-propeller repeat protein [Bacteroidales bacterium]MCF8390034.1 PQQ-binding-like beta-propeller repeat protein [Bacteroidales bacterium]
MNQKSLFMVFFLTLVIHTTVNAQEPSRWRGGEANGVYPDTDLLQQWPESGPEILWTFGELGQGHSSVAIAGEFIYTAGMIDTQGSIFKFDQYGKLIYKKEYGPEFSESYVGTRGTPVIAGNKIYILSGHGILYCMNEKDGSLLWKKDLVKDFGGEVIRWGYNETPVVDGDVIYTTPGRKNSVVALNRHNGALIWTCQGENELSAYCTPLLFEHNGRKIIATHTGSHLLGIEAKSGKLLWSHPQPNQYSVHANTPIYHDGGLFFFSGYGQGSGKLNLSDDGNSVSLAWNNVSMDSRMGGAVFVDGYIYGSGDKTRSWKCIDWKTGANTWESTDVAKGVTIFADGLLFGYSDKGELFIAKADPKKFEISSLTKVTLGTEQHWAHPVISKGVLYVRHGNTLIAYKIK